jgi:hypothetical protein
MPLTSSVCVLPAQFSVVALSVKELRTREV